jgi:hypothetical protein
VPHTQLKFVRFPFLHLNVLLKSLILALLAYLVAAIAVKEHFATTLSQLLI